MKTPPNTDSAGATGKTPEESTSTAPAADVQLLCKVLRGGLKVGNFRKGRGREEVLPAAQANELEKRGDVKVLGPAPVPAPFPTTAK